MSGQGEALHKDLKGNLIPDHNVVETALEPNSANIHMKGNASVLPDPKCSSTPARSNQGADSGIGNSFLDTSRPQADFEQISRVMNPQITQLSPIQLGHISPGTKEAYQGTSSGLSVSGYSSFKTALDHEHQRSPEQGDFSYGSSFNSNPNSIITAPTQHPGFNSPSASKDLKLPRKLFAPQNPRASRNLETATNMKNILAAFAELGINDSFGDIGQEISNSGESSPKSDSSSDDNRDIYSGSSPKSDTSSDDNRDIYSPSKTYQPKGGSVDEEM